MADSLSVGLAAGEEAYLKRGRIFHPTLTSFRPPSWSGEHPAGLRCSMNLVLFSPQSASRCTFWWPVPHALHCFRRLGADSFAATHTTRGVSLHNAAFPHLHNAQCVRVWFMCSCCAYVIIPPLPLDAIAGLAAWLKHNPNTVGV